MTATARSVKDSAQGELHLKMLRQMLLIRRFEEKAAEAYALGKIGGFCHLYIGQEAVAVGALAALRDDDYVICSYREHGQALINSLNGGSAATQLGKWLADTLPDIFPEADCGLNRYPVFEGVIA